MTGLFVTGTDTDVGKTVVSAWVARSLAAEYWKPVQTGSELDRERLRDLVPGIRIHDSRHALPDPLSPHQAARRAGIRIELTDFTLPRTLAPLVVEGAGGVLVPLNDRQTMLDLMEHLGLPVLVVARSGLGTINHTLLTLAALRSRGLAILGVVTCGPLNPDNADSLAHFGQVPILGQIPRLERVDAHSLAALPPFKAPIP